MFGEEFTSIPIVEVSMDDSYRPDDEWELGAAVRVLRQEGLLVLSGGLTIHNLRDFSSFSEAHAAEKYKVFDKAVLDAVTIQDVSAISPDPYGRRLTTGRSLPSDERR
jgi:aromatic ring-opening dioxygenase catalytic subunit (LigB family)